MNQKQFSFPNLSGRSILRQVMVGSAGGWALTSWIETRRFSSGVNSLLVWTVLALVVWAATVRKTDSDRARKGSAVVYAVLAVGLVAMLLCTGERAYFVNGATYPAWLTQGDLGHMTYSQLGAWQETNKCFQGEVERKADGREVFRCGGIWWPVSSTYFFDLDRNLDKQ